MSCDSLLIVVGFTGVDSLIACTCQPGSLFIKSSATVYWEALLKQCGLAFHALLCGVLCLCCAGPAHCYVVGFLQPFGKTQKGKMATKGCLRHKDPLLDVQSALGRYFVTRFTLGGEVFPDPCSRNFLTMRIWPGRADSSRSLMYQGHRARFAKIYEALDIKVTKVTHAPRYHSARKADEEGVPEEVGCCH